jgi:O-antigen/teichoic acid export membrane protein
MTAVPKIEGTNTHFYPNKLSTPISRALSGIFAGGVSMGVMSLIALIQVPILLSFWSVSTLGQWTGVMAAASLLTCLDTGHQTFLGNKFCALWVGDKNNLYRSVGSGIRAAFALGVLQVLAALAIILLAPHLKVLAVSDVDTSSEFALAILCYLIYWTFFGSIGGVLVRLYLPAGLYSWGQWLGLMSRASMFMGLIAGVAFSGHILGAMVGQLILGTCFNVFLFWDLRQKFGPLLGSWRSGSWQEGWQNLRSSIGITAITLLEQLVSNGLLVYLGSRLGPVSLLMFSTLKTLANTGLQGSGLLLGPLVPDLIFYRKLGDFSRTESILSTAITIMSVLFSGLMLLLVPFGGSFYGLWTRGAVPFDATLFALIAFSVGIRIWTAPFNAYLGALNLVRAQLIVCIARVAAMLVFTGIGIPNMGLMAAALGLCVGEAVGAILTFVITRRDFIETFGRFEGRLAFAGLIQSSVAGMTVVLGSWVPMFQLPIIALGGLGVLLLLPFQWRSLPHSIKCRLFNLILKK